MSCIPVAQATPQLHIPKTEIDWAVWGANGKIYYWNRATGERHRLDPPAEWSASNPGPFPDRPAIIHVTEEEARFDYLNPGQAADPIMIFDVFPDGRRFIPTYCGTSAVVDGRGKILTKLWSIGCDEPPFEGASVTSDGRFVVGP